MHWDFYTQKIKVFLPECTADTCELQKQLEFVFQQADIEVYKANEGKNKIYQTDCSVHILGAKYGQKEEGTKLSKTEYWLSKAKEVNQQTENYNIFVWYPPIFLANKTDNAQEHLINSIRNSIFRNMIFTNHESPVMLVEDMRSVVFAEQKKQFDIQESDILFIYNEIDEDAAEEIVDMLSDVSKVEKTKIALNAGVDYAELISRQIQKSQLTVVYYNRTASWSVSFTQQIWKKIGGASANKQILLIGDANVEQNMEVEFNAPNVKTTAVSTELIPLEIKVEFDKLNS